MAVENRGPQVAGVTILFLSLSWVFVSLRCYVRAVMMKSFGVDDWLAVASLVLFTLYGAFVLKGVEYGTGQHIANIPLEHISIALKWWWCCELAYVSSTAVLKVSIGIFLARICIKKSQVITIWTVNGVIIVWSIFYFFLIVFQCSPITSFWTQYTGEAGKCITPRVITNATYAHSAVSAWADWVLGILPIFLVWDLAMNPRTKASVALILALGALGSTATIVRIPYISQLAQADFLYATSDVAIWSTVEPGIGITAAAMATLRPLFRTFLSRSRLLGSSSQRSGSQPWPSSRKLNRAGYVRSGSGSGALKDTELGLRNDIGKDVGITTTIKSTSHSNFSIDRPIQTEKPSSRSGRELTWSESESESRPKDHNSEDWPFPRPKAEWSVRKTTEVVTSQEVKPAMDGSPRPGYF